MKIIMQEEEGGRKDEAMKKNEEKYSAMLSSIGDHVRMMDRDLTIVWANDIALSRFGDDIVGRKCYEAYHNRETPCEPHLCIVLKAFQDGQIHTHDTEVIDKQGNKLNFHCTANVALKDKFGSPETVIEISRDVTQRAKFEEKLRQAQKMEAVGTLAEGIAHDFNNILGIILGNAEMALLSFDNVSKWDPVQAWLDEIKTAAMRAKDVVKRIHACTRYGWEKKPVHMSPVIKESVKRLRMMVPSSIEIKEAFSTSHDIVLADPAQIHQLIMNLCTNAYHAMADKGGVLKISLENITIGESSGGQFSFLTPGLYVKLTVADTGHGIDPDDMNRIFDPYHTTKEAGIGIGLGLFVVRGIVEDMEGDISVDSEPGKGARFIIFIPVAKEGVKAREISRITSLTSGTERILFIDDEEALVQLGNQMLDLFGYQVTGCISPLKALELFKKNPDSFDLVITDMTMPMMTGDKLAAELVKIRPDIPVIMCTGNKNWIDKDSEGKKAITALILKPVHMDELGQKIREVLDGKGLRPKPED